MVLPIAVILQQPLGAMPEIKITPGAATRALAAPAPALGSYGASEALLARVQDKGLVKTKAYVGGQWVGAKDGTALQVRVTRGPA